MTENELLTRCGGKCELCASDVELSIYDLPASDGHENEIMICENCSSQIAAPDTMDMNHWRCLNDSMWSQVPAVQVMSYRMLKRLSGESWAQDLLDMLYLEDDLRAWGDAEAAAFLRKHPLARQALQQGGRAVSAEVTGQQSLLSLSVRWLKNENDTFFQRLRVERSGQGFQAALETSPMNTSIRMTGGTVTRSLYDAADEARLPDPVIHQLTQIFSNQIDFHRTLRKGARFSVVYEVLEADGEPLRTGRVLSAEFHNDNQQYDAVWFQEPGQKGNYYDMDGKSLSRSYLASPLTFSRQSSGFAMRLHPIFNTMQAHRGVDYAAPTGTPAMTVGDGVVTFAGRQGGYGNVVEIRHGNGHSTLYAHLSRIQVRTGQTVQKGQVIGAVGSTGWSTGPHLHFEFRVNGVHVDPQKIIQQAQSGPIAPASKARFAALVRQSQSQLQAAAQMREVSSQ